LQATQSGSLVLVVGNVAEPLSLSPVGCNLAVPLIAVARLSARCDFARDFRFLTAAFTGASDSTNCSLSLSVRLRSVSSSAVSSSVSWRNKP
jgi:hypothetical protein